MTRFVPTILASALGVLLAIALVLGGVALKMNQKDKIEDHSWLHLDLYGELPAYDPPAGIAGALGGGGQTLQDFLTCLDMAEVDDRIDGVVLQISASQGAGRAKIQELRGAVARIRAAGKPVLAYADNLDLATLYLAAACDSVICPPSAYIQVLGMNRAMPHVRETLAKLGITAQMSVIKEYKSAAQMFTRDEMTPEAIQNATQLYSEVLDVYRAEISTGRGVAPGQLDTWLEKALFTADEALDAGMIDRVAYWDEIEPAFMQEDDEEPRLVGTGRYGDEDPADFGYDGDSRIAVIHAQGNIGGRENGVNPVLGMMMGHESITRELEKARRDEDVVAIVLRVDSGGGESLASDLMGHKVAQVAREKPVVVSMVDVAASGGYMMSYRATRILADPLTVTGSIGSISGKFDLSGFHEKIGMSHTNISVGANARLLDGNQPFSEEEFALYEANHLRDFQRWIDDVARHRGLAVPEVENLAMGRVWTGNEAVRNGLIDATGGLHEAIAAARELAGIDADEEVGLWHLPERQGLLASLLGGRTGASEAAARWYLHKAVRADAEMIRTRYTGGHWHALPEIFAP